jgi:hypothetical protein
LGGIDGANGQQLDGRTLIFQKQEDFPDGMSDSEAFLITLQPMINNHLMTLNLTRRQLCYPQLIDWLDIE